MTSRENPSKTNLTLRSRMSTTASPGASTAASSSSSPLATGSPNSAISSSSGPFRAVTRAQLFILDDLGPERLNADRRAHLRRWLGGQMIHWIICFPASPSTASSTTPTASTSMASLCVSIATSLMPTQGNESRLTGRDAEE